jgi:hypothetical protein
MADLLFPRRGYFKDYLAFFSRWRLHSRTPDAGCNKHLSLPQLLSR